MIPRTYTGAKPRHTLPEGTIDTQTHMYLPDFPAAAGAMALPDAPLPGPDEYRKVMEWLGISRVVITQGNAHGLDNSNLLAALAEMGDTARGVACITGQTSDAELQRLHDGGVRGARVMDLNGGFVKLDQLEQVQARAKIMGWMMAVQFDGSHIAAHYDRLSRLQTNWVLDHHGKFFAGITPDSPELAQVKRLIDKGNCWFKFSGCYESSRSGGPDYADIAAVARDIAAHAPERIVWGTNFPHNMAPALGHYPDDAALMDLALDWMGNDDTRRRALVDTPAALYGF